MQKEHSFAVFKREAPQVFEAFNGLISAISTSGSLDAKTRQLIYIGIKAAQADAGAVAAHVPMARGAGATREEIRDTILLTLSVCGVQGITHCLVPALAAFEQAEQQAAHK